MFEAGFTGGGALALADVMLPESRGASSAALAYESRSRPLLRVKDYHRDDVAVQSCIAAAAGIELASVALAHIDNSFIYPGGGDYRGLFHEEDLTAEAIRAARRGRGLDRRRAADRRAGDRTRHRYRSSLQRSLRLPLPRPLQPGEAAA